MSESTDGLGRPVISPSLKDSIASAFSSVPDNKRGALLLVADEGTNTVRAHVAAKIEVGDHMEWKVAAGGGWDWGTKKKESAFVAVLGTW